MGVERDAVRNRFKRAETAPYRHQEKETQINERANLRDEVKEVCWRLGTEVAQHNKVGEENAVKRFVPAGTIS